MPQVLITESENFKMFIMDAAGSTCSTHYTVFGSSLLADMFRHNVLLVLLYLRTEIKQGSRDKNLLITSIRKKN